VTNQLPVRDARSEREPAQEARVGIDQEDTTMTDQSQGQKAEKQIEILELNRETIQDLTEWEGWQARGGRLPPTHAGCNSECTGEASGCLS
jgi:hypothetical protein